MKKILSWIIICSFTYQNIQTNASSFDTSFNQTGITTPLVITQAINQTQDLVVLPDNKIIVVGSTSDYAVIVKYNEDGTIDQTFNQNQTPGYVQTIFNTPSTAHALTIQPDDQKIIIVGYTIINNVNNAFIARYTNDGILDTTFNSSGYIITTFGGPTQFLDIGLQSNGNIIVGGWTTVSGKSHALVARFLSDGTLDTTFNSIGYTTTLIGSSFTKGQALALQAHDKIVLTGQALIDGVQGLIAIRYNTDGSLDTTFNSSGDYPGSIAPLQDFYASQGFDIIIQPFDQKIVISGSTHLDSPYFLNQYYTILRLDSNGTLDTTFNAPSPTNPEGTPGYNISDIGLVAQGITLQINGKILACGYTYTDSYNVVVNRYDSNGIIDPTFNFSVSDELIGSIGTAIAVQNNGKIIITGSLN